MSDNDYGVRECVFGKCPKHQFEEPFPICDGKCPEDLEKIQININGVKMSDVYEAALKAGQMYYSAEVTKNTKGYTWSIKVAGMDVEKVKGAVVETEGFLARTYGNKTAE
jgi:hypothetical protein